MKFSSLFFAAVIPATSAWNMMGGRFGPSRTGVILRSPMMDSLVCNPEQVLRRKQAYLDRALSRVSPRYEITEDDQQLVISLDVPGVSPDDISVTLEDDGKVLAISGQRERKSSTSTSTSRFSQSFALDPTIDVDKISANLQNGVLIVTASKDLQRIEQNIRKIPVNTVFEDSSVDVKDEEAAIGQVDTAIEEAIKDEALDQTATTDINPTDVEIEDSATSDSQPENDDKPAEDEA